MEFKEVQRGFHTLSISTFTTRMITVISGTNRKGSLTYNFSREYYRILKEKHDNTSFFDLCHLPDVLLNPPDSYYEQRPQQILDIQDSYFRKAEKLLFIVPEYNGSYPGILKLLIDGLDPKTCFAGKKAALTGIATGRAGNLRGLDHLAMVLQHMGTTVLPYLLPVSKVHLEINSENHFSVATQKVINKQAEMLISM